MSTKLTARKRYLPRVKAGVTEFKKLSQVGQSYMLFLITLIQDKVQTLFTELILHCIYLVYVPKFAVDVVIGHRINCSI